MPFLICRQCQRSINKRDNLRRKIRRAAIANPLRIAPIDHETRKFERGDVAGHPRLGGAELSHQFADAMLAPVPYQPKSPQSRWLGKRGENHNGIHGVT